MTSIFQSDILMKLNKDHWSMLLFMTMRGNVYLFFTSSHTIDFNYQNLNKTIWNFCRSSFLRKWPWAKECHNLQLNYSKSNYVGTEKLLRSKKNPCFKMDGTIRIKPKLKPQLTRFMNLRVFDDRFTIGEFPEEFSN